MLMQTGPCFERIGDYATNIIEQADRLQSESTGFSDMAKKELSVLCQAIREIVDITLEAFARGDNEMAKRIEPLEETIDDMVLENRGYLRFGSVGTSIEPPNDYATGIVVGDFTSLDEKEHIKFARYTSAGVELFDGSTSTVPVATISKYKITITSAEFNGYVKMGKYRLDLSRGIAFKWEEG
jgi:hypothetical protein